MKRVTFYGVLFFQALVILIVAIQYDLIDDYGETILLLSDESSYAFQYWDSDRYNLDYEINYLSEDSWEIDEELDYREKLYVILEPDDDGIYHAVRATKNKPILKTDEIMLPATYSYYQESLKRHHVEYGIEEIRTKRMLSQERKQWLITVELAPWGAEESYWN